MWASIWAHMLVEMRYMPFCICANNFCLPQGFPLGIRKKVKKMNMDHIPGECLHRGPLLKQEYLCRVLILM